MNTENFRNDLRAFLRAGNKQFDLSRLAGVPQATISKFVNSNSRDISLKFALKLWDHVYGVPPCRGVQHG